MKNVAWGHHKKLQDSSFCRLKVPMLKDLTLRRKPQSTMFENGSDLQNFFLWIGFKLLSNLGIQPLQPQEKTWLLLQFTAELGIIRVVLVLGADRIQELWVRKVFPLRFQKKTCEAMLMRRKSVKLCEAKVQWRPQKSKECGWSKESWKEWAKPAKERS